MSELAIGRIDIIAAQLLHAQLFGFQLEITLEDPGILPRHIQQRVHRFIRDVVLQVADRHGTGEFPQADVLVVPVTRPGLVHLPEDGTILAVDAIQLLVGLGPQVGVRSLDVGHAAGRGSVPSSSPSTFSLKT